MLIDDMYGEEADDVWSALDTHPNMEVRLYNPFVRGHSKNLQLITHIVPEVSDEFDQYWHEYGF